MRPYCSINVASRTLSSECAEAGNIVYNYGWPSLLAAPPSKKQDNSAPTTNVAGKWTVTQTVIKSLMKARCVHTMRQDCLFNMCECITDEYNFYVTIACISVAVDGRNKVISEQMCYYNLF